MTKWEKAGNFTSAETLRLANLSMLSEVVNGVILEQLYGGFVHPANYAGHPGGTFVPITTHKLYPNNNKPAPVGNLNEDIAKCRFYDAAYLTGYQNGDYASWVGMFYQGNISGGYQSGVWFNPAKWEIYKAWVEDDYAGSPFPYNTLNWIAQEIFDTLGYEGWELMSRMGQPTRAWFKQIYDVCKLVGTKQLKQHWVLGIETRESNNGGPWNGSGGYYAYADAIRVSRLPMEFINVTQNEYNSFSSTLYSNVGFPLILDKWSFGKDADLLNLPNGWTSLDETTYSTAPASNALWDIIEIPRRPWFSGMSNLYQVFSICDYKDRYVYQPQDFNTF